MSCEHRSGVDPDSFLSDPRNPEHREFSEHYPGCEECSGIVEGWTSLLTAIELAGSDAGVHLAAAQIVAYSESPNDFAEGEKARIADHLADCRSCADEFEALRSFPFDAIADLAMPTETNAIGRMRDLVRGVGGSLVDAITGKATDATDTLSAAPDLALAFQSDEEDPEESPSLAGMIAVISGDYSGAVYPLRHGETALGRHPSCQIHIQDPSLERVEVRFVVTAGRIELLGEHPANPPVVNDERIASALLADGDEIRIGSHRLQVRVVERRPRR